MPFNVNMLLSAGLPANYANQLVLTLATPIQPGVNAAPAPVFFDVADVTGCLAGDPVGGQAYMPKFHEVVYLWDFGDTANATPSTAAALRMPAVWKNVNLAFGMNVCHVYNDPGTYTVTCYAYEPASRRFGVAQTSVTIGDPRSPTGPFQGARTIIFNPGGLTNPATFGYPNAQNITGTWNDVINARTNAGMAAQTAQILIAPTAPPITQTRLVNDTGWANIRIGGLDPAVKPVIGPISDETLNIIRDYNTAKSERVLFGLRCTGAWNSTTERGRIVLPMATFNITSASYLAMQHRCEFDGWELVGPRIGTNGSAKVYNVNSELIVTNWQNYGLHGGNSVANMRTAVIACAVTQHVDALSGGGKDTGFYNNHGCFRSFEDEVVHMSVCDLFSRNGWSAGGTGLDGLNVSADQACIRLNTTGVDGYRANIERVALEGMIWLEEQDRVNVDRPGNYVFDKIIQIAGPRTLNEMNEIRVGGCTFRNGLGIIPDRPSAQSNRPQRMFYCTNEDGALTPFANDQRIAIHNVALFDFRSYDVPFQLVATNGTGRQFTNIVQENNVVHRPGQSVPVTGQGPFDLVTTLGVVCRHKGPRFNFAMEEGTFAVAVPQNGELLLPYSGIRNTRYNPGNADTGPVTDQAFWQANPGTLHKLIVTDPLDNPPDGRDYTYHTATPGDLFEVRYDAGGITLINRSTRTWAVGWTWRLHLDRTHILPAPDPQFDLTGYQPPTGRPAGGPAATGGDVGLRAYDDLLLTVRPNYGNADGPLQP